MITDGNPHQDGLIDHHRLVYLPYSEDKNLVMELPNSPGLFFTSQIISGGEFIVAFDKTMHKYWVISINQVYTPSKVCMFVTCFHEFNSFLVFFLNKVEFFY